MSLRLVASLALALPLTGCLVGQRLNTLEAQSKSWAQEAERLDSTTEAIEKNRLRIDEMVPGDAQWMTLELGGILRWYLGQDLGNAYVQFREGSESPGEVTVAFSSSVKNAPYTLRPGVSIAHPVPKAPEEEASAPEIEGEEESAYITLTLHRVRYPDGQSPTGLFSVTLDSY